MKKSKLNYRVLSAVVMAVTLLTTSCVELKAIRKFAATSAVVGQKFPALSADVYGSCTRRYKYRFYRVAQFNARQMKEIDELKDAENLETFQSSLPVETIAAERDCRRFKEIELSVVALNQALVTYMQTMGDLAADDLTSYDKKLDALGSSITGAGFFNENEVGAGKNLAKFILDATTNFYRRKKLKTAIETRNEDVKLLAQALKRFVGQNYILELRNEQRQLNNYYQATIQEHQDRVKNADPLLVLPIKAMWNPEQERLQSRIDAAEAYVKILDNVSAGHQKLYDSRNNLNSKEMRQTAMQYARNIESLVEDFRKPF